MNDREQAAGYFTRATLPRQRRDCDFKLTDRSGRRVTGLLSAGVSAHRVVDVGRRGSGLATVCAVV